MENSQFTYIPFDDIRSRRRLETRKLFPPLTIRFLSLFLLLLFFSLFSRPGALRGTGSTAVYFYIIIIL